LLEVTECAHIYLRFLALSAFLGAPAGRFLAFFFPFGAVEQSGRIKQQREKVLGMWEHAAASYLPLLLPRYERASQAWMEPRRLLTS
jgi:hypothetical protein